VKHEQAPLFLPGKTGLLKESQMNESQGGELPGEELPKSKAASLLPEVLSHLPMREDISNREAQSVADFLEKSGDDCDKHFQIKEAAVYYQKAIDYTPQKTARLYFKMGECLFSSGCFKDEPVFEKTLDAERIPEGYEAGNEERDKYWAQALPYLAEAARLERGGNNEAEYLSLKAYICRKIGLYAEALHDYERIVTLIDETHSDWKVVHEHLKFLRETIG
jgi:tetratricopeptide (TPR) repeat protein